MRQLVATRALCKSHFGAAGQLAQRKRTAGFVVGLCFIPSASWECGMAYTAAASWGHAPSLGARHPLSAALPPNSCPASQQLPRPALRRARGWGRPWWRAWCARCSSATSPTSRSSRTERVGGGPGGRLPLFRVSFAQSRVAGALLAEAGRRVPGVQRGSDAEGRADAGGGQYCTPGVCGGSVGAAGIAANGSPAPIPPFA